ncbi:hypothetical protein HJC23_007104 [Cyclotella cryptica]|uniref:Uncharacterized protein n=1 Tax=Cyclotella cryptica TaxID=29204 RepID=A0ABD3P075_9STRA
MTPQEISFTNAFNANRPTLALFAKCTTKDELHIVRDTFFLGMASQLCPKEYESLRTSIITDPSKLTKHPKGLESMITAARASLGWKDLVDALHATADAVGSDLDDIWMTLEAGRLEWLGALNSAHPLKVILKDALKNDNERTKKDEVDAKMVWMYALSLSVPKLSEVSETWRKAVNMDDKMNPLKNYNVDLWDCRKDEWKLLDLGVQEAAERGGSSVNDAWEA